MKHIKTPVKPAEHDIGSVYEADGTELCRCYGMVEDTRHKSHEIATALNERDDLIAQRDALWEACSYLIVAKNRRRYEKGYTQADYKKDLDEAEDMAGKALALVRGKKFDYGSFDEMATRAMIESARDALALVGADDG